MRLLATAILILVGAHAFAAEPIVGRASVIDGDTLDIRGQRFRLQGVDTFEKAQLCQDVDRRVVLTPSHPVASSA